MRFFEIPNEADVRELFPRDDMISVLIYSDGDWRLLGDDENYARFFFNMMAFYRSRRRTG